MAEKKLVLNEPKCNRRKSRIKKQSWSASTSNDTAISPKTIDAGYKECLDEARAVYRETSARRR